MLQKTLSFPRCTVAKQGGMILIIALVVLVSMTLAAAALVRAVNSGNLVMGALEARQEAASAADIAINQAMGNFLGTTATGTTAEFGPDNFTNTYSDNATFAYLAEYTASNQSSNGIPNILLNKATFDSTYTGATAGAQSLSTGETYRYLIERMCDPSLSGSAATSGACILQAPGISWTQSGITEPGGIVTPVFRVSVRVDTETTTGSSSFSSHNATTYAQVMFHP